MEVSRSEAQVVRSRLGAARARLRWRVEGDDTHVIEVRISFAVSGRTVRAPEREASPALFDERARKGSPSPAAGCRVDIPRDGPRASPLVPRRRTGSDAGPRRSR